MDLTTKFANAAFKARTEMGYTQDEVAEAISVSVRWYQMIESGRRFPGSVILVRLLLILKINVEEPREEAGLVAPVRSVQRKLAVR